MTCGICGAWLGNGGLMFADALWNAGMGNESNDLIDRVCGNVDSMFNACTRAVVDNTLSYRRGESVTPQDDLMESAYAA